MLSHIVTKIHLIKRFKIQAQSMLCNGKQTFAFRALQAKYKEFKSMHTEEFHAIQL